MRQRRWCGGVGGCEIASPGGRRHGRRYGGRETTGGFEGETLRDRLKRRVRKFVATVGTDARADADFFHGRNHGARNSGFHGSRRNAAGERCAVGGWHGIAERRRRGSSGGEAGDGAGVHESLTDGVAREVVNELRAAEADFDFFWMNVDVHFVVGHFEEEECGGRYGVRMNVSIGLVNGVEDEFVANEAFVDKDVDAAGVGALDFWPGCEAADGERGFFFFGVERWFGDCGAERRGDGRKFDEFVERLATKELVDAVG